MNEKQAKKIGEVLAFATLSLDTFDKAAVAAEKAFGKEFVQEHQTKNTEIKNTLHNLIESNDISDISIPKSEKTHEKIGKMRDLYIGDEWDNPTELMEWMGFFEGAAIVHWALIEGVGEKIGDMKLSTLATSSKDYYQSLLNKVTEEIRK